MLRFQLKHDKHNYVGVGKNDKRLKFDNNIPDFPTRGLPSTTTFILFKFVIFLRSNFFVVVWLLLTFRSFIINYLYFFCLSLINLRAPAALDNKYYKNSILCLWFLEYKFIWSVQKNKLCFHLYKFWPFFV